MKKPSGFQKVLWAILITLIPILFYLLIDVGSASQIFRVYENLKDGSGENYDKSMIFLETYIKTTGDLSLGQAVGLKEEEMQDVIGGGTTGGSNGPDGGDSGGGGIGSNQPKWDAATIDKALKDKYNGTTINPNDTWKKQQYGRAVYITQKQGYKGWQTVKNDSNQSLKSAGCMWFACSSAASIATGKVIGVEDLLKAVGYTVNHNNGTFTINGMLPCVGMDSGKKYANGTKATPTALLSTVGVSCSEDKGSIPTNVNYSNSILLIHCKNDNEGKLSSGGQHWFLIVGEDNGKYVIVEGSGSAAGSNGSVGFCDKSYVHSKLNHCYVVATGG